MARDTAGAEMDGINGFLHRTRTERDAKLYLEELESRGGRRPGRREQRVAVAIITVLVVGWLAWTLLTR